MSAPLRLDGKLPSSAPPSDGELVSRVRAGDAGSFELLMRRYNQRVYRTARAILRNDHDAEDVVQETFLSVHRHLDRFEGRSRFSTWLTRIAVNHALRRLRSARPFESLESVADYRPELRDLAPSPPDRAMSRDLANWVLVALDGLPAAQRAVVVLRDLEGLDTAETAAVLRLRPAAVRVGLHRARRALRQELKQRLGAEFRDLMPFGQERCDRAVDAVFARLGLLRPDAARRADARGPLP